MNHYLGIDPGLAGSYALINEHCEIVKIDKLPTVSLKKREIDMPRLMQLLEEIKEGYPGTLCVLEKSQAMPGQGVTSMFSYGVSYGLIKGAIYHSRLPFIEVHPRTWVGKLFKGVNAEGKDRAFTIASQLFPGWDPKFKYEKDWADSLLIAEYGRRA